MNLPELVSVGAVSGRALVRRDVLVAEDVLFAEQRGDGGALVDRAARGGFEEEAADAGVDGQGQKLLADARDLAAAL